MLKFSFNTPTPIEAIYITKTTATQLFGGNVMVQGSNDNTIWKDLMVAGNPLNATNVTVNGVLTLTNSNKFALTADFTHNFTSDQNYGFDGQLVDPINKKPESGSFYNFSLGIIYYLGENRYHSDWY